MEYQHGGDIYSQDIQMDYSANINPLGMPEAVRQALRDCLEREVCSLYPDSRCERLRQALGRHHGVEDKWIICGNGAADLIFGLAAALRPVRGLVTAPAFSEYEQALRSVGCRTDYYYLREDRGFALDAAGMCGCVRAAAERGEPYDVVFLCNPNNPTGRTVSPALLQEIWKRCEEAGILLVVDECFNEFLEHPEQNTLKDVLETGANSVILKAFTKSFAMPGLRLGYGLCGNRDLAERIFSCGQPWGVSIPAQAAGVAALQEQGYLERMRRLIQTERRWLSENLARLGLCVFPSEANYILFRTETEIPLRERMEQRGVLIRACGNYRGLDNRYYRIAVRGHGENERLIAALKCALEE